ncbi:MAG: hypothetical protein OQJ99_10040 [Rhodospirillales bacterium]|nr:hypothetical protein [Rhodospirillales bacterium]MCW8861600.1 hypothetical protein [Rhodospirillales bacterium]MCW8951255.1 hypothetical protein [Rhodospirillales bacterium]MCW8971628.1 hypothetical protein [Rhodospirillales bacterium]MCW9002507.1 hypothetical protein [Rhodospirillales bacterium]
MAGENADKNIVDLEGARKRLRGDSRRAHRVTASERDDFAMAAEVHGWNIEIRPITEKEADGEYVLLHRRFDTVSIYHAEGEWRAYDRTNRLIADGPTVGAIVARVKLR